MFEGTYAALMAEYNVWMNDKIYAACAGLSAEELKRDRGAFFRSIHATLNHVLWGDRVWLGRFNGKTYPVGAIGVDLYDQFAELRAARHEMDQELLGWARSVTRAWLDEPMTWQSRVYAFSQTQPRWVLVVQMFNHQTHHRGQVHAMLTPLGIDVAPTDVPLLPALHVTT
jgi:uncharacterized damage-inducible protein DinB